MRKTLAPFALALILTSAPIPGQTAKHPAQTKSDIQGNPSRQQKPSVPPLVVNSAASQVYQNGANRPSGDDKPHAIRITALPPKDWTDWIAWLTGIVLTGIGGAGVYFAIRTLRAIEDQAKLMVRQADLVQASFDQWVELTNWRIGQPQNNKLRIMVDLINTSNFPVAIISGHISVVNYGGLTTSYVGDEAFLPPNRPTVIDFWVRLSDSQQAGESLSLPVTGQISHWHRITKGKIVQPFIGRLDCGPWAVDKKWHATYVPLAHMNPERTEGDAEGEQKAN